MQAMEGLLTEDATLEMTGTTTWFSGKTTCVPFIADQAIGQTGDWRMIPTQATVNSPPRRTTATRMPTTPSRSPC
ncbi:MAG: hypothetical protein WAL22_23635 [Solirubrobacteraceae bacterium]